ncbi:ABC transporter related protein OS=Tsukamurella paurometabola (strain ATCC 8368 / DSM / CCUG 35730 / CIP 100753 / JCM 10117 / KCTC 9821 / NBRC 16120 / NCIMB 702349 / NCTC 13040) OX=521096 GN=Tpau_3531 PE=4 SV=1 [Tsukamurella paurometabola]|uniref:ABC transporter related protein n=1 Tax=Tsukamurella paurometabola (strain ATCC 8368 / DSM 20162 / CCUG 35730 / CIP 100753 / JCM 10117 / KCTC 9821 / NBRC 16120 / NCIMB 702349 / NCTC 13040) TaxID=521096 RepID=D5UX91_TSUPD|nr:ABC transporter ATP-binding protein [Tsukamurella paurometabola]ADG80110.1 ABC transporter related protein [Tsukamurella paurometabola DSM 20162]SUP38456.1 Doxorubicin resistance ATP-binding protein DrrA [Tsukamurella paurometabola]
MTALRAEPATTTDTVIAATGLRRTYGSGNDAFEAVRGVDLDVRHGEVFALLGTNGAGKTSTLDLLEGLAAPSAGELTVFGRDPLRDRREVRPLCGIMLQSGGLPAELTVRETLQMWRGTCSNPTDSDSVLARVHLTDRADVRVRALSGGEQRRVDLACALIGQPRLLFLDEPTTGLDPESRRATWRLLAELKADGVTMVLTTHYLDEAEALADRIAIMHRGEIARLGTLRDIVEDHPAVIAFDDPGAALPVLPGARVSAVGSDGARRLTVETHRLQPDLHTLLDWAADRGLPLTGLQAHAPSLESVFLSVADATNGDPR